MSRFKNNVAEKEEEPTYTIEESQPSREDSKTLLKKFMDEETKLVKGKFRNVETPGASAKIIVRKYPKIPMFDMVMEDGRMYEIPLYVARHLNGTDVTATKAGRKLHTCAFPTHGFKFSDNGMMPQSNDDGGKIVPLIVPTKWTRRYAFESLEFDTGD